MLRTRTTFYLTSGRWVNATISQFDSLTTSRGTRYAPHCHERHSQNDDMGTDSRIRGCGRLPTPVRLARTFIVLWQQPNRASLCPESRLRGQSVPQLNKRADKGPGDARPLFFLPGGIRDPHLENRIGMASQYAWWICARRLGRERAQRVVNPWPAAVEVRILPGAPPPLVFNAPLRSPGGDDCLSSRTRRVRFPSRAPKRQMHQGGLTGRARGPEPRDGGSSPSPGAKTTRPGQVGRRRPAKPPRSRSIREVGSNAGVAQR